MNQAQVTVVGGGAAGIAAATRLVQNGFQNVTVLEAEDRLGGRCNTVTLGDEHADLGAQLIHGKAHNVVYEMAAPLDLTKDSIFGKNSFQLILPNGKPMHPDVSSALSEYCNKILTRLAEQKLPPSPALSLGEAYVKSFNENLKDLTDLNISTQEIFQYLDWFNRMMNSLMVCDSWDDVLFEDYLKRAGGGVIENLAWKTGGYSNIIDLLLQKIPATKPEISLNVLFGEEVTRVESKHGVVVKCASRVFTADHVIVAVPLGVLKHNAQMFSPPLPAEKLSAISTLAYGAAEKLLIQFPRRWWPENASLLNILLDSDSKEELRAAGKEWLVGVVAFYAVDNAPNTLCGYMSGRSARYISELPDDVVRDDVHYYLKRYFSGVYTIPAPVRFARSNWCGNPHFRGSYSFYTPQSDVSKSLRSDLAEPIFDQSGKPVIMFAGEATHPDLTATVNGAVETGWREADRLISYYK